MAAPRSRSDWSEGGRAPRRPARGRLFRRSFLWGLAVGAAAGGAVGAVVGLLAALDGGLQGSGFGLALVLAGYGAVLGSIVAVVPSLVGAAIVTELISTRHPDPVSEDVVQGDLRLIFGVIIAVLNGGSLLAVAVASGRPSAIVGWLPFLLLIDAAAVPMLWRARRSIARSWFETSR